VICFYWIQVLLEILIECTFFIFELLHVLSLRH
jgi:hypothetical protein